MTDCADLGEVGGGPRRGAALIVSGVGGRESRGDRDKGQRCEWRKTGGTSGSEKRPVTREAV